MLRWQKYVAVALLFVIAILCVQRFAPDTWNQISAYVSQAAGPAEETMTIGTDGENHRIRFVDTPTVTMNGNIATIQGEIKNISHQNCKNITFTVTFTDEYGNEIGKETKKIGLFITPNSTKEFTVKCTLTKSYYAYVDFYAQGWFSSMGI